MKRLFVTFMGQKQNLGVESNPWRSPPLEVTTTDKELKRAPPIRISYLWAETDCTFCYYSVIKLALQN